MVKYMSNHFLVNPTDGTINLHYDSLNPSQVQSLIGRLEANLRILKMRPTNPIEVLQQSVRLDRGKNRITFQLSWNTSTLTIDLNEDDVVIPAPNLELTNEQHEAYVSILTTMIGGV